jgi:hypothetical protein
MCRVPEQRRILERHLVVVASRRDQNGVGIVEQFEQVICGSSSVRNSLF